MIEAKEQHLKERQKILDEQTKLEQQMDSVAKEKEAYKQELNFERLEFVKVREEWTLEKRRVLNQMNEERKAIALERAELEAQRTSMGNIEIDLRHLKEREEAQLKADRIILDRELRALRVKQDEYHRESALIRAGHSSLDMLKSRLETEHNVFEAQRKEFEAKIQDAIKMHAEAMNAKQAAQSVLRQAQMSTTALEEERNRLAQQKHDIEEEKKKHVEDRLALANQRCVSLREQGSLEPTTARVRLGPSDGQVVRIASMRSATPSAEVLQGAYVMPKPSKAHLYFGARHVPNARPRPSSISASTQLGKGRTSSRTLAWARTEPHARDSSPPSLPLPWSSRVASRGVNGGILTMLLDTPERGPGFAARSSSGWHQDSMELEIDSYLQTPLPKCPPDDTEKIDGQPGAAQDAVRGMNATVLAQP
ncbi:uncharacterized protein BJ171DRAFT_186245 [Polychytrium aggregatum]|uniref:uncharacterized protein n=1 Tax=Polychytrium aggregatum TaxID=110093 RepID=UPI0022FDD7A1|nr:uncharacterized protein BJ171DRAFT_186245 [Polychytrium aggregatum]KAI9202145.1 hypothetical protein BJ171DRAFT_186245 [Polychytrium aggregatum]